MKNDRTLQIKNKYEIQITKADSLKELPDFNKLGFGQFFSDYMFVAEFEQGKGWYDFKIKPYAPFQMDPAASVLHYGQALFEGLKAFKRPNGEVVIFRPEFNALRFKQGAERLCMVPPPEDLFVQAIHELVNLENRWIPKDKGSALYIRPTLIGTEGFLGVRPSRKYLFFVILSPVGAYYSSGFKPVKIWVEEEFVRAAPGGLGQTKAAANYVASLKAAELAKINGYSQVLWLDVTHKYVEEVGTMNVFFVVGNKILTPLLDDTILPGGVRSCAIQLLKDWGYEVVEKKVSLAELQDAYDKGLLTEAFGTGTAAVITSIGDLSFTNKKWLFNENEYGPIAKRLYEEITAIQSGTKVDKYNWIHLVSNSNSTTSIGLGL